jgi:hypothetical protein
MYEWDAGKSVKRLDKPEYAKMILVAAHREDPTTTFSTFRSCPVMFRFIMTIYTQDMCQKHSNPLTP